MSARSLMVLGTASHVGKSILTAALGRILADDIIDALIPERGRFHFPRLLS